MARRDLNMAVVDGKEVGELETRRHNRDTVSGARECVCAVVFI